ncbi:MAG: tryptophan--tRNA ligase [Candidatus Shikimatogenerans sp. Tser]|uniref:tryptophan--tRNA ligase n=1 Tax=Candidatus Shikimatogenerans sp. Tser TaxID=3158568 RepID=A0AAU7QQ97_9FLAO
MKLVLLGIKNNGTIHIGHLFSIIYPAIKFIKKNKKYILLVLIADLHNLTYFNKKNYNKKKYKENIYKILSIFLSFEINLKKIFFYKQSDTKKLLDIFWFLNNLYKFNRLKLAHRYKSTYNINIGEFIYPILMASDIISLNIKYVFIGNDQKQNLEITKILIKALNNKIINNKKFYIPKFLINKKFNKVIGIDGRKMSKSYKNTINVFDKKNKIKRKIFKIKTNSNKIQNIKDLKKLYIYKLYKYFFNKKINILFYNKKNIYNFYKIKNILYNKILNKFKFKRQKYFFYLKNKKILKNILKKDILFINKIILKNYLIIKKIFL